MSFQLSSPMSVTGVSTFELVGLLLIWHILARIFAKAIIGQSRQHVVVYRLHIGGVQFTTGLGEETKMRRARSPKAL